MKNLNTFFLTTIFSVTAVLPSIAFSHSDSKEVVYINEVFAQSAEQAAPQQLGSASDRLLNLEITLEGGYGRGWYFETPTTQAEELVNQGFAMFNMFQYVDAFRSFNTAIQLDPKLTIAYIGKALNAANLDGSNTFYLVEAYQHILDNAASLDAKTLAWADLYLSMVTGQNLSGASFSPAQAYSALKIADQNNYEVYTLVNWIAGIYNIPDMQMVLQKDPQNAGALHYLMHLEEGRNNHQGALDYALKMVPLVPNSAHGQHMLGHVLPHFNRWAEGDKQFEISHQLHLDWTAKNNAALAAKGLPAIGPEEDWHYGHNLTLMSVTRMVVNPSLAVAVLSEIENVNPGAIIDTLDYLVATLPLSDKAGLAGFFNQVEGYSPEYKNYVLSSRLFFNLVFESSSAAEAVAIGSQAAALPNFKNKSFLQTTTRMIAANSSGNTSELNNLLNSALNQLNTNFSRGGFDGWQQSVIETLMYKKVFEVYGLDSANQALQTKIIDVYMNPVD